MMADLKNLTLGGGGSSRYSGDEQVQFIPGGSHQVTIRSPPPSLHLENLNNVVHGSQNNLHCSCNGTTSNGAAATVCTGGVLARKVPNHSGASPGQSNKRPAVALTHLPKRPPVDVEFKNLAYSVSEGRKRGYKTILKCVNGKFRSGELTAIMGPSGAGKSTLMNVLAGYKTSHLSGSVLINGKDRNLRRFRKMSCYIMQDDQLLPHLTVYEAMTVSANLKLGKDISQDAKKVVIEEIIETLGLREASNTQTQSLSGGQRKRLSIALELVNNPPVMFFDESTSGLDSSSCFQCLNLLKSLSRGGKTLTRVRLISHVIVGFLIGAIYYDIGNEASEVMSNAGCVFFTVMFLMFTAMMPTICTFPMEMSVFVREHLNYWYSLKAFYLARTLADIPFQMVYSIAYVIIVYFLTSQPLEVERFLMYLNICILTSLVAQSLGLLIGAAMSVESGVFIGPVISVPIILFSGFFVNFKAMPKYLKFLSYMSYVRYGFEGTMISVYGYNRAKLKCSEYYCHFKSPTKFLEQMAMENAVYWVDVVALLGFLLVLRVIVYFVLKLKLRSLR
ncbi:ATP-binding cassette sub-family G member 4-like [Temnothorax curvispinosus]|uniref:ATP-binding cassette sub-family G member 4-like n=1 Tax=Temnothorax curvispinosus TaxID=300111 RepID=A0A6J1PMT7_9HYME|nr:ATP-binding cassette sub-family G member 4-like [Temnothorax curvispinosus]